MADPITTYTVKEFCAVERISKPHLYVLWRQGKGPRFYRVGSHRRITEDARRDWQREREDETRKE